MLKNEQKNIILCGLGGQGVVLLGKLMGNIYMNMGYQVKVSDIMGLGQRNGDVRCHLRYSTNKQIYSPFIVEGEADYIISLEMTEATRNAHYLKAEGSIISSDFEILPSSVSAGLQKETSLNKLTWLRHHTDQVYILNTDNFISSKNELSQLNTSLLGYFTKHMNYDEDVILNVWKRHVNKKFWDAGLMAFQYGVECCVEMQHNE